LPIKNGGGDDARFWLCCGFVVSVGASVGVGLGVCVGEGTRVIESHAPCSSLMANDGGRIKVWSSFSFISTSVHTALGGVLCGGSTPRRGVLISGNSDIVGGAERELETECVRGNNVVDVTVDDNDNETDEVFE